MIHVILTPIGTRRKEAIVIVGQEVDPLIRESNVITKLCDVGKLEKTLN